MLSAALLATAAAASARSLHWSSIEVEARLDAEGRLHVRELQTMVFDGEWNGGERRFRLGIGQKLELQGLRRIDRATGERVALAEGELDAVDRFAWHDRRTLRWRSRLPSDPPFAQQTIVYELEYTLSRILQEEAGTYRVDHDFAFADREGVIERFVLDLELDPAWLARSRLSGHLELEDLAPGLGAVVTADLAYVGAGRPAQAVASVPLPLRFAAFAAALAAMGLLGWRFRRHEASRGRYEAVEVPARLEREWLEQHLFDLRPEEAGALWDGRIGPPEVAATLARLVGEGKLASSVKEGSGWWRRGRILALELLVERDRVQGYERRLVDKLFFNGRRRTDTEAVRKRYAKTGFDPAGVIRGALDRRLRQRFGRKSQRLSGRLPWLLFAALAALSVLESLTRGTGVLAVAALLALAAPAPLIAGSLFVRPYRRWTRNLGAGALAFALLALALAAACWGPVLPELHGVRIPDLFPGLFGILALALFPVWALAAWLSAARTRDSQKVVRRRQELAAIRRSFASELKRPLPALEDAWFPYLMAFGLDRQVGGWFESFGGEGGRSRHLAAASASSAATPASGSPGWTGGGGSFGGAGASAGWGMAAAGLAAGVAQPSSGSSSGGGGSSGGGSSSGGGGGGGW